MAYNPASYEQSCTKSVPGTCTRDVDQVLLLSTSESVPRKTCHLIQNAKTLMRDGQTDGCTDRHRQMMEKSILIVRQLMWGKIKLRVITESDLKYPNGTFT